MSQKTENKITRQRFEQLRHTAIDGAKRTLRVAENLSYDGGIALNIEERHLMKPAVLKVVQEMRQLMDAHYILGHEAIAEEMYFEIGQLLSVFGQPAQGHHKSHLKQAN